MITQSSYTVEPWCVRERALHLEMLSQSESVFALSNGHIGLRGNLDEGEPHGLPGSYLNGVYELRPLPQAETGYGYPESGQTVINVTDAKLFRLLVDDEPFDVRYGTLKDHERVLDLRAGTLTRRVSWVSPARRAVRISSVRLVSLSQRALAAICYEVEPVNESLSVVVQSELVANEPLPIGIADPRAAAVLEAPLRSEVHDAVGAYVVLLHSTKRSGIRVAAAMDHEVDGPEGVQCDSESFPDVGRFSVTTTLQPGERLRLIKYIGYGWSMQRSLPAMRDQVAAAIKAARKTGWEGLLAEQRAYLDAFWERADVVIEGAPEIQQAVRFALFHAVQAAARAEQRAIPAKGLTGPGYDGHCFWDTETYVLPMLTYSLPTAVADALRWRQSTLPLALERARQLGFSGSAFPWRTIAGEECSGYWPAGTGAFHVNADIADAVIRYVEATGDEVFERDTGLELLAETARLWRSLGHHDPDGNFRIDGVTGPDEYSAIADNNVYTNLMAQRNLYGAADTAARHPHRARDLGISEEEMASWRDAAGSMLIPYDPNLGVHPQAEGFTEHEIWDFARTPPECYPLLLHYPYFDLYRKQVIKQADLVLALWLRGDAFTDEQKARNFEYYEALTVRDSSLSAGAQAVIAAEVGHLELAFDYLREAALLDLYDLEHNTSDGLHMAALAGVWIALIAGFGGMRDTAGTLHFSPRLPERLTRLAFTLSPRQQRLHVDVSATSVTYSLLEGQPLEIAHHKDPFVLRQGEPRVRSIPPAPVRPRPRQPPGREPDH